jgi:hypothetical protein
MLSCLCACLPVQTHFKALFMKRFRFALRDKKAVCFQLVIPILALLLGLIFLKTAPIRVPPEAILSVNPYNSHGSTRLNLDLPMWSLDPAVAPGTAPCLRVVVVPCASVQTDACVCVNG